MSGMSSCEKRASQSKDALASTKRERERMTRNSGKLFTSQSSLDILPSFTIHGSLSSHSRYTRSHDCLPAFGTISSSTRIHNHPCTMTSSSNRTATIVFINHGSNYSPRCVSNVSTTAVSLLVRFVSQGSAKYTCSRCSYKDEFILLKATLV
ncbi:hypothetical protein B0H14DRAFT_2584437 [Mycena olivaceomarginata]|nr:hypothetical protein B0H14DRAFT_2584437 [Mycena olivaceomarginata]